MSNLKLGRKPPVNKPVIPLKALLKAGADTIPAHPVSEDFLNRLSRWGMLGNDQYGDCVGVTWANERRVMSYLSGKENYPTFDQVIEFYKTQNPNFPSQDDGMVIQLGLEELEKNGGPDGVKALGFAKVDHTNLEEVKAALAIFGMVWVGVTVQSANMDQFNAGQPWDYVANSQVDGGHSVVAGGYLGTANNDVRFITWAQETGFTDNFWSNLVDEAWVVIWPEHLGTEQFQAGIDLNALANAYKAITGRDFPVAVPTPTPTPVPTPTPTPGPSNDIPAEDKALLAAGNAWEKSVISHFTKAGKLKDAFNNWKTTKGYN